MTLDGSTWTLVLFAADGVLDRGRPADQRLWLTLRAMPRWGAVVLPPGADRDGVAAARREAAADHGADGFGRCLMVGRSRSSLALAHDLGLAFVGCTEMTDAAGLRDAGAAAMLPGFADLETTLSVFAAAPEAA